MGNTAVKILIACHKDSECVRNEVFVPIQVGAAVAEARLTDALYDDRGENISGLNPMYCELTAQYWAWKNLESDYYGFCHYRRYFNFSENHYREDAYGNIIEKYIEKGTVNKYALNDAHRIRELVGKYDIITTKRMDLRKLPGRFTTVKEQYEAARLLHAEDMETVLAIIRERFPEYSEAAEEHCSGHVTSFYNMYILRKDIFFRYCEWMFAVLDEFCKRTDMSRYSTEALRTPGHLAERLFGIFYSHIRKENPALKTKELQCVLFENTEPQKPLEPAFPENAVPVVFAANNNFVPMFAASLQSLLEHSSPANNYDIVLLQSDVSRENKETLLGMVRDYPNVSLRFFDAARLLVNHELKANAHISVETYYRFLIQDVLPEYDKVLYLDCDLIVNADVAELYRENIEGYMLAAVRDADFLGQINGANEDTKQYIQTKFRMKEPYGYFQAGVILFNEKEMRKAYSLKQWLDFASVPYKYNDQDVLNLYCEGRVKYLDMAWNLITDCNHTRVSHVIVHAPDSVQREYRAARNAPKIIHYAGFMKPWHRPTEDFAQYFWDALRRTPYYEQMLFRLMDGVSYWQIYENEKKRSVRYWLVSVIRKFADIVFPLGSVRREKLRKFLGRE